MFLKLCVENSGVLGKGESVQLTCLEENDVTRLSLLAAVELKETKLTALRNDYAAKFSDSGVPESSVEECANEDDISLDDDILEMMADVI